jgi:UDP:flavonoid glycosyltransferase YjiC (YdhE family)
VGVFEGHVTSIIEVLKDLKSLGHNVTCYVLDKYEERLKLTGARLITYSIGEIVLPPKAPI